MRAVVQRVSASRVLVGGEIKGAIGSGLSVLVGVCREDTETDAEYLAEKLAGLRVFPDADGVMNLSLRDLLAAGRPAEALVVSQFTLYGDCRKGRRPSYIRAEKPEAANRLYEEAVRGLRARGIHTQTGVFRADMQVEIINDGPVTLLIDSQKEF